MVFIFSEASRYVSNMFDEPLDLNREGSTFMNHGGAWLLRSGFWRFLRGWKVDQVLSDEKG